MSPLLPPPESLEYRPFVPDPGFGLDPGTGAMLQLALQLLNSNTGTSFLGVSDRNIFDRLDHQRQTMRHNRIVSAAAEADRESVQQMSEGVFRLFGMPYGEAQREAAEAAGIFTKAAPLLVNVMDPMTLDSLVGRRGSSAVMAHYMDLAARQRTDPGSGMIGMSEEYTSQLISAVWDQMYAGEKYRGSSLPAGSAGRLFQELQTLGLAPGTGSLPSMAGLSSAERKELLSQPGVSEELASFDAAQITQTLNEWGKAVEAMREVFGDAGMPNAPFPVLMRALRQLAGGDRQLDIATLTQDVRTLNNLAKSSGFGMEAAMQMVQGAEVYADRLGVDVPGLPMYAAMRGMAFAQAWKASGRGEFIGWGQPNIETLAEARKNLEISAAASPLTNRILTAIRMQDYGGVEEGSEAEAFLAAARAQRTTYTWQGETKNINMTEPEFVEMLAGSSAGRLSAEEVQFELTNRSANLSKLAANREISGVATRIQGEELRRDYVFTAAEDRIRMGVKEFLNVEDAASLADALSRRVTGQVFEMDPSLLADKNEQQRIDFFQDLLATGIKELADSGDEAAARLLDRFGGDEEALRQELRTTGAGVHGTIESYLQAGGMGSFALRHHLHSEEAQRGVEIAFGQSMMRTQFQEALDQVGKGGALRRFTQALMEKDVDTIPELLGRTFGAVRGREIVAALEDNQLINLRQLALDAQEAQEEFVNASDDDRADKYDAAQAKIEAFRFELEKTQKHLLDQGLLTDERTDASDVGEMAKQVDRIRQKITAGEALKIEELQDLHADALHLIDTFRNDPALAARVGTKGVAEIERLDEIRQELLQGPPDDKLLREAQTLLESFDERMQNAKTATEGESSGIRRISVGNMYLEGRNLGRAEIEFPEEPNGP